MPPPPELCEPVETGLPATQPMADNPLRLKSIHHVEFWVGNAKQAAYYYRQAFGFSQFAYAGLETGRRDAASYALQQGKARIVLTTPLRARRSRSTTTSGSTGTACATSPSTWTMPTRRSRRRWRAAREPVSAPRPHRRARHGPPRGDCHLRRTRFTRSSRTRDYRGPFLPGLRRDRTRRGATPACCASTTWWATSNSAG